MMQPAGRHAVVDVALRGEAAPMPNVRSRARVLARLRLGDTGFRLLTKAAAVGVLVILGGVMLALVHGSVPALEAIFLNFNTQQLSASLTAQGTAIAPI